jgi:adenylylsulfate kinase-like enzyme
MVYLITGKKGAGKTTYAVNLLKELRGIGNHVTWIDGDRFREETGNKDFSDKGRWNNLMLAAKRGQEAERDGNIVILSFISPRKEWRQDMRRQFKHSHLVYIPGGSLWEGTDYEVPDVEELCGVIRGRMITVNGIWVEVATYE